MACRSLPREFIAVVRFEPGNSESDCQHMLTTFPPCGAVGLVQPLPHPVQGLCKAPAASAQISTTSIAGTKPDHPMLDFQA